MASEEIICGVCGANNAVTAERCGSCGAKIIRLADDVSDADLYERRHQQDSFSWKWAFISFGLYTAMAAIAFGLLPSVIATYDPQGFSGVVILIAMWFVGGVVVNFISSEKTFFEPAVGGLLAAFPAVALMSNLADVYEFSPISYMVAGLMGVMMALMGAFVGHRLRGDLPERPVARRSMRARSNRP